MYNSIITYMKSFSAENSPSAKCKMKGAIIFIYISSIEYTVVMVKLTVCENESWNN